MAAGAYVLTRWLNPMMLGYYHANELSGFFVKLAPWLAGAILALWLIAEVAKWIQRQQRTSQTGIEGIRELSGSELKESLADAFRQRGYQVEHSGQLEPTDEFDMRLTQGSETTLVLYKYWKSREVGIKIISELLANVNNTVADAGIVVTSGGFTNSAIEFASKNRIRLIDGAELLSLIRPVDR